MFQHSLYLYCVPLRVGVVWSAEPENGLVEPVSIGLSLGVKRQQAKGMGQGPQRLAIGLGMKVS